MGKQDDGRKSRASFVLEEFLPDVGPVQDGFAFLFRRLDDPPRIQFDLMNHECTLLLARVFFEHEQFRDFLELASECARDAGVYMPAGDGLMLDPGIEGT